MPILNSNSVMGHSSQIDCLLALTHWPLNDIKNMLAKTLLDGISPSNEKTRGLISFPVVDICNLPLIKGIFPVELKITNV